VPWQLAAAELWRGSTFVAEALALALAAGGAAAARACAPLLVAGVADALARAAAPAPARLGGQGDRPCGPGLPLVPRASSGKEFAAGPAQSKAGCVCAPSAGRSLLYVWFLRRGFAELHGR